MKLKNGKMSVRDRAECLVLFFSICSNKFMNSRAFIAILDFALVFNVLAITLLESILRRNLQIT
jgi:hypothetical protein